MTDLPDGLERLWSPWRSVYIVNWAKHRDGGCPFCDLPALGPEHDEQSLILHRGDRAYAILNAYPYNPGHLMAVPYRHVAGFDELTSPELHELADISQRAVRALTACGGAQGFNLGVNVGGAAGAGIADHLHQQVVPRWGGDTSFFTVVGQTRVLPELLAETYERLAPAFGAAGQESDG
ncbi:MAG: HIT family protein [Gemmatimonadales bacterium]